MKTVPWFTYSLGRSLYVPVTARCNSQTLPETRGPNFTLPPQIVAALCRFRDAEVSVQAQSEQQPKRWEHWCHWLDTQEYNQPLPPSLEKRSSLDDDDNFPHLLDDLLAEIDHQLTASPWDSLVLGGEGEPLLRPNALHTLCTTFQHRLPQIRLLTNGLLPAPWTSLKDAGVSSVSIALMTSDPAQYQQLMLPVVAEHPTLPEPHARVVRSIQSALDAGLDVEITAVDRRDVHHDATEQLARSLGVASPVRWRPYFG